MKEILNTGMAVISRVLKIGHNAQVNDIVERSAAARVEPYVMLDSALLNMPEIKTVLQCATSHYAAYYSLAFALETDIGLETTRILDSLSTERRVRTSILTNTALIGEDFSKGLPMLVGEDFRKALPVLAGEARDEKPRNSSSMGKDVNKLLMEQTNLSVGKIIEMSVERNGEKVTVPIIVRLHTIPVGSTELASILTFAGRDDSVLHRIKLTVDGDIDLIDDFLLNSDIIKEEKKIRKADRSGAYSAISKRRRGNFWAGLLSGNPSINVASAIAVVDSETIKDIEARLGSKVADGGKARTALFNNTKCMLIISVNRKWEEAIFYYRSISEPMKIDFDDMRISNKSGGVEMEKILGELIKGNPPSF